jgi:cobalt-zinc-cadmium efflux system membrane fusion protein
MDAVHVGETADIHLNAYPNTVLKARIANILPTMDPTIRTAKVRLEVQNPGMLRIGMFTTATFYGKQSEERASVPATAILHIHDRDWAFVPLGDGKFKRLEVTAGGMLPGKMQEIVSGVKPGDQVVENALVMQNTVEQ